MFPILYDSVTIGTVPQNNGLGVLSDCISCVVEEGRNDIYELTMEYPASGIHAQELAQRRVLKVKPNFTDPPQLFRIDRIGKTMGGSFTVYAKHISYDVSGYFIASGSRNNVVSACAMLTSATQLDPEQHPDEKFTIDTTKTATATFSITEPSSVRSWFGGKEGSLLDIYGGEWKYNNFICSLKASRGENRGVTIRYGKNLLELSQEMDCSNLYTHVVCYYKGEEGSAICSQKIATGLAIDVQKVLVLDVTSEFESQPSQVELNARAAQYISQNNLTVPLDNVTLNFVQIGELKDRVDLCDTVTVYYEALGINAEMKCIRTKWDCLREKYIETEFGDARKTLSDTMSESNAMAESAKSSADAATNAASSKKRVFVNTPTPPYDVGDLWVSDGEMYVCNTARAAGYVRLIGETTTAIEEGSTTSTVVIEGVEHEAEEGDVVTYNDEAFIWMLGLWTSYVTHIFIDWELATNYADKSDLENAISDATQIITGIAGGLVILLDTNDDGSPDEIIITNDNDFHSNTARLWRWNAGGLGYSQTGYDGEYQTAITIDPDTGKGQINADMITLGNLNAQLANIQDLNATMFSGNMIAIGGADECKLVVLDASENVLIQIDRNGMECFGEETGGVVPSVVFDKNGVTGYSNSADKANTAIFWTHADEFHMKKCVLVEEMNAFGKIRMIPMQVLSSGTVVNDGIGFVAIV